MSRGRVWLQNSKLTEVHTNHQQSAFVYFPEYRHTASDGKGSLFKANPFTYFYRWRLVFSWRIWNWLSPYWNKCFLTMIMVLIVLFLGKQSAESDRHHRVDWHLVFSSHVFAHCQMLCVRCRSTQLLNPCSMPKLTRMCTTMSIWSCSEPRGTSTYLVSLSSSGCWCHFFYSFRITQ